MKEDKWMRDKLIERYEVTRRCEIDQVFRLETLARCAEDTLFWMDNFAWTYDPRQMLSGETELPFIPFQGKQREYVKWLDTFRYAEGKVNGFVDKSRATGGTALTMNVLLKHWLFDDSFNARIGSRKEEYVDKAGDADTLFYKVDYTYDRLPKWMKVPSDRAHMRLTRSDSPNTIIGESSNPNFARGGRQTLVVFDEIGFWNDAKSAWGSSGHSTNRRLAITTPPETGRNSFAYKLLSGQEGKVDIFEFNHSDIPYYDSEWLQEQREGSSEEEFNREVLKSYAGSIENKVYATNFNGLATTGVYEYNPALPLYCSWDFGFKDPTSIIWLQRDIKTNKVYVIDCYENNNKPIDFFVPFITGEVSSGVHEYTPADLEKISSHRDWRKDIVHFGDPSGNNRTQAGQDSIMTILSKHGIYVQSVPAKEHYQYWQAMTLLFRRLYVNELECEHLINCITMASYPKLGENSQRTRGVTAPIHDWTSHMRTALEYYAINERDIINVTTTKPKKISRPRYY